MPYTLTTSPPQSLIQLVYEGTIILAERKQARDEVFRLSREQGLYRVSVDMRNSDIRMSRSDAFTFALGFQGADLPDNYRLACLIANDSDNEHLVELLIAQDSINIRYFYSEDEALRWLMAV